MITHRITGKQIRILKTEAHIYKNQKTIVWLRNNPSAYASADRLQRWDSIVIGHELAHQWNKQWNTFPSAIVIREPTPEALEWIVTSAPKSYQLLCFSKKVIETIGVERAKSLGFTNIICLEEMGEVYPQLFRVYEETDSDVDVCLMIAIIFRSSRLLGLVQEELQSPLVDLYKRYNLTVDVFQEPEPLWLIQQYYTPNSKKREDEIKKCLEENMKQPYIDKIVLLNETKYTFEDSPKIEQVILGHRMKYKDVLEYIQTIPPNTIVVFANSDIYLTDTFKDLWSFQLKDIFVSLLRYEESTGKLFGPRPDSQDTWIVHAESIQKRTWNMSDFDFPFGQAGCDNVINAEMLKQKFLVVNPCLSLKTMHVHSSNYRTYDPKNSVDKPVYLHLIPTGLHDLEPNQAMNDIQQTKIKATPYTCQVNAYDERTLKTFCSMASRNKETNFTPYMANILHPKQNDIYTIKDGFMTTTGLIYGYKSMYVTKNEDLRNMWVTEKISHMTPCIGLKSILAVPYAPTAQSTHVNYIVEYLSKILHLRQLGYKGEFWVPREPNHQEWIQMFRWDEQYMPVIPRDENIAAFGENVTMTTPSNLHKEDVEALRSMFKTYTKEPTGKKRLVILQDDELLTSHIVKELEIFLEGKGYLVDIVYPKRSSPSILAESIVGAHACVSGPGCKDLFWLLPNNIRVIDCMGETRVEGYSAQVAGACSLDYWVVLLPRGKSDAIAKLCVEKVDKTLEKQLPTDEKKPIIVMPTNQQGFHAHSGDTFREMARLWAEKGYVEIQEANTPFVWLGGIGETLLYDRPTFAWLKEQDPPTTYKKILCGNPPPHAVNGIPWSFWPRRPSLVEELAPKLYTNPRTKAMVFYGAVENTVQKKHRNNRLGEACEEYSLVEGANYKFTQEEYLRELAKAKYGLCLTGFGAKCNREIECMALGTVPVVAPDVDMDNYNDPPQKDVHYIRLMTFTPEHAKQMIQSITDEQWLTMSTNCHAWWKKNASVDGLWATTQRLSKA